MYVKYVNRTFTEPMLNYLLFTILYLILNIFSLFSITLYNISID